MCAGQAPAPLEMSAAAPSGPVSLLQNAGPVIAPASGLASTAQAVAQSAEAPAVLANAPGPAAALPAAAAQLQASAPAIAPSVDAGSDKYALPQVGSPLASNGLQNQP
jgi:hypothetical protein